MKIVFDHREI
jgi:hypothetical protein